MKSVNDDVGTIPSDGVTDLAATKALYSSTTTLYCLTAVSISISRFHISYFLAATKALYSSTTTLYCLTAVSISYSYFLIPQFDSTISKPEAALVDGFIGQSLENLKDLNRQGLTVFGTYPCNPQ